MRQHILLATTLGLMIGGVTFVASPSVAQANQISANAEKGRGYWDLRRYWDSEGQRLWELHLDHNAAEALWLRADERVKSKVKKLSEWKEMASRREKLRSEAADYETKVTAFNAEVQAALQGDPTEDEMNTLRNRGSSLAMTGTQVGSAYLDAAFKSYMLSM